MNDQLQLFGETHSESKNDLEEINNDLKTNSLKQFNLFGEEFAPESSKYTSKIKAPIYEPKNRKPYLLELYDDSKTKRLIREIELSNAPDDEKAFLIKAAGRHTIFNYEKIADYYAHATKEVQYLMEHSALIIIDFERAIEFGYIKLSKDISNQYMEEYGE